MSETYQGWTNYETWVVNLWMSNDEGTYEDFIEIAKAVKTSKEHGEGEYSQAALDLSRIIQEYYEANIPDLDNTAYTDLLNSSLSRVEWREIAQNWLDDMI